VASDTDSDCSQLDDLKNRLSLKMKEILVNPSEADVAKTTALLAKFLQLAQKCQDRQCEGKAYLWGSQLPNLTPSERKDYSYKAVDVLKYQENSLYADSLYNLAFLRKEVLKVNEGDDCKLMKEALRIYRLFDRTWSDYDISKQIKRILNDWDC
jgi:hypothetical protein